MVVTKYRNTSFFLSILSFCIWDNFLNIQIVSCSFILLTSLNNLKRCEKARAYEHRPGVVLFHNVKNDANHEVLKDGVVTH
jgi:hypothetical protein